MIAWPSTMRTLVASLLGGVCGLSGVWWKAASAGQCRVLPATVGVMSSAAKAWAAWTEAAVFKVQAHRASKASRAGVWTLHWAATALSSVASGAALREGTRYPGGNRSVVQHHICQVCHCLVAQLLAQWCESSKAKRAWHAHTRNLSPHTLAHKGLHSGILGQRLCTACQ